MKYNLFIWILLSTFSCNYILPQEEENDLMYFLSNSWELISSGNYEHNLVPIVSLQDSTSYSLIKLTLHNTIAQDSTFRYYVLSYFEEGKIINDTSSQLVGSFTEREVQYQRESVIAYDRNTLKENLHRHLDPVAAGKIYLKIPLSTSDFFEMEIDERLVIDRIEVFKKNRFSNKIIIKHESFILNEKISSMYHLYQKLK
ncbi:MAG: hypothetical protein AAF502_16185 [Bacteroidota bacterium]